jgi:predicted patatin/cPLA2 family phospholipase
MIATTVSGAHTTPCNLLALSGGGSFGAVEAGILDSLVSTQQIPSRFDVITGISAGGLNAGFLYYYENVTSALPIMKQIYTRTHTQDVYVSDIWDIFSRWSLYDNGPLEKTLIQVLENTLPVATPPLVLIGASNIITEELDVFRFHDLTFHDRINVMMATSSIPIAFPPRAFQGSLYVDGGVISNEMIHQAIGEIQCSFYNITFISAHPKGKGNKDITGLFSYISAIVRMIFRTFDNQMAQVSTCAYPKGQINACYPTSEELDKYSMLDFDNGLTLYELGKASNECTPYPLC